MSVSHESPEKAVVANMGAVDPRAAWRWPRGVQGSLAPLVGIIATALIAASLGRVAGAPDLLPPAGIAGMVVLAFANGANQAEVFALAVVLGAILWVFLATRVAMPVSTTHAITGSLVPVGTVAVGVAHVQWGALLRKVALPLVASPFIALAWVVTLPLAGLLGVLAYLALLLVHGG